MLCVRRVETTRTRCAVLDVRTNGARVFVPLDELDELVRALAELRDGAHHVTIGDGCRCPPDLLDLGRIRPSIGRKRAV